MTVLHDRVVAERGLDAVFDLLSHMAGRDVSPLQVPTMANRCRWWLRQQFPDLVAIRVPEHTPDMDYDTWLARIRDQYGQTRAVTPLPGRDTP